MPGRFKGIKVICIRTAARAELRTLAIWQVSELSKPLRDNFGEQVTDRLWPGVRARQRRLWSILLRGTWFWLTGGL